MNRFSVIYLLNRQYHHIYCATQTEAYAILEHGLTQPGYKPIGIYDAKTELFYWEPTRQHQYNRASIERQGKIASQAIQVAQNLRHRDEAGPGQANSIAQLLQINN
jgi:hypothetical protein